MLTNRLTGTTEATATTATNTTIVRQINPDPPATDPSRTRRHIFPTSRCASGDQLLTTRSSEVVEFFYEGRVPSDHAPVVATFTFDRQL